MANYVLTIITFPETDESVQNFIIKSIGEEIDFNNIIPEPKTVKACPIKYLYSAVEDPHITRLIEKPWFNWYDWRQDHWGTVSNALDTHIMKTHHTNLKFIFQTKWTLPEPIIKALMYLNHTFIVHYASETGSCCGQMEYDSKTKTLEEYPITEDSIAFADYLWEVYS